MELKKVTVIQRFDLGGKTYPPGPAEIPADKVDKLREKKLIASEDAAKDSPLSGSTLETELLGVLLPHAGEAGNNEGAVETLTRLIAERDKAREEFQKSLATNQELIETNTSLLQQIQDAQDELVPLRRGIESVAGELPPLAGLEKAEDEPALDYLGRYTEHFKTVIISEENGQPDEPVTMAKVTSTPVSAEELITLLGSAKPALALLNAGLDTREKLMGATNDDLDKIEGVGEASIAKIREFLAA